MSSEMMKLPRPSRLMEGRELVIEMKTLDSLIFNVNLMQTTQLQFLVFR